MPKRKTVHDFTGSVNVKDDITPVTRQKIEQLDASKWPKMSLTELSDQHTILSNRIMAASQYGASESTLSQMQRGLIQLEFMIKHKSMEFDDETESVLR